jgi:putative tricarboxylic transport membrane protein
MGGKKMKTFGLQTSPWLGSAFAGLMLMATPVFAQAPTGPVEITVGSSAGGTPDVLMRNAAKILNEEKIVENPLVVANRTGGSWTVAANHVLGKAGDKNTLMAIAQPMITTPIVQGLPNTFEKLSPISVFVQGELMLVVQPDSPFNSLADLVKAAKEKERGVRVAGAQTGGTDQMATGLLEKAAGVKLNYIPFDGGGAATAAFLGKNVEVIFLSLEEGAGLIESKKAKPLAILSEKRRPEDAFKNIPTAKEQGVELQWGQFWGIACPPDSDPQLVAWWEDKIRKLVASPAWTSFLAKSYYTSNVVDSASSMKFLKGQHATYLELLRSFGLAKQ